MRYAPFLKENDTISLIAPSFGVIYDPYLIRANLGIDFFTSKGFTFAIGKNVYRLKKAQSNSPKQRALEFMNAYKNPSSSLIWAITGGELEALLLPFLSFEKINKLPPKWFAGYSDNTCLGFLLTTICDIATFYVIHIGDFCLGLSHESLENHLQLFKGENFTFSSYAFYENKNKKNRPLLGYNFTNKVLWKSFPKQNIQLQGRLIGGCLDVLITLCGTKYDKVKEFIHRYPEGILFFFDVCEMSSLAFYRGLFQLQEAGWFTNCKGIIIGRIGIKTNLFNVSYLDVIKKMNFPFPVIYDCDLGHIPPVIPLINGSFASITLKDGKGTIQMECK